MVTMSQFWSNDYGQSSARISRGRLFSRSIWFYSHSLLITSSSSNQTEKAKKKEFSSISVCHQTTDSSLATTMTTNETQKKSFDSSMTDEDNKQLSLITMSSDWSDEIASTAFVQAIFFSFLFKSLKEAKKSRTAMTRWNLISMIFSADIPTFSVHRQQTTDDGVKRQNSSRVLVMLKFNEKIPKPKRKRLTISLEDRWNLDRSIISSRSNGSNSSELILMLSALVSRSSPTVSSSFLLEFRKFSPLFVQLDDRLRLVDRKRADADHQHGDDAVQPTERSGSIGLVAIR